MRTGSPLGLSIGRGQNTLMVGRSASLIISLYPLIADSVVLLLILIRICAITLLWPWACGDMMAPGCYDWGQLPENDL